jgi:hypothetical protein
MVEPPNTAAALTATEARAAMGRGDLTPADLVSACSPPHRRAGQGGAGVACGVGLSTRYGPRDPA